MADVVFESIYHLEKYINQKLEKAMDSLAKEITKELKDNYQKLWYDRPFTPNDDRYKRTHQLLKGIENLKYIFDNTQNKTFDYNIGFYGTRIQPREDKDRFFNAYMSLDKSTEHNGMPITEAIAYWIEKGTSSPHYDMPEKHIFQITAKKYDRDKVEQKLKNSLRRQGISFG